MRRIPMALLAGFFTLWLAPVASAQNLCGDCDQNNIINVVDALTAAQIAGGLVTPNPTQQAVCDVDSGGSIDVLDALTISQFAAGLPVALSCPGSPVIQPTSLGYCVIGNLNGNQNWQIAVADADPSTGASYTSPPLILPETQIVTVNTPWPTFNPAAITGAFTAAIATTQTFTDLVNSMPAVFATIPPPAIPGGGLFSCFVPVAVSAAPVPVHFASIGIVNPDGTICYADTRAGSPGPVACPFNPNVILVDFNEDDNGNEIPDALEDYIEDCNDPETCDDDG
ncbi:MAG: dockerin type I repeat-containing protein, partial [Acidobacteriota bacterium]